MDERVTKVREPLYTSAENDRPVVRLIDAVLAASVSRASGLPVAAALIDKYPAYRKRAPVGRAWFAASFGLATMHGARPNPSRAAG